MQSVGTISYSWQRNHCLLIVPTLCVGMQLVTLCVTGARSVPLWVATQSVATIDL